MGNRLVGTERIEQEVREALGATLRTPAADIDLDRSIIRDLNATSIDFLDVNFKLESTFGIRLATQLLLEHVEEVLGEGSAIDADGRITEPAAKLLRMHLGERPGLEAGLYADEVPALVTPRILVKSVDAIVARLPQSCARCGKEQWMSADGCKVACGDCDAAAPYPDGDALTREWIQAVEAEHRLFAAST